MYTPILTYLLVFFLTNICIWAHESWVPDSCYSWLSVFRDMGGQSGSWDKQITPRSVDADFIHTQLGDFSHHFLWNAVLLHIIHNMTCIIYLCRSSKPFMSLRIMYFLKTSGGTVSDIPNAVINNHLTMVRGSTRIPAVLFCRLWWWWSSHYWKWQFSFRF